MHLVSDSFVHDGKFPRRYTKDGDDLSPPLRWSALPEGTRELALVFENVTPHTNPPFVQWLVYKISPKMRELPEGFKHKRDPKSPADVLQGRNSQGNVGYDGPLGTVGRVFHLVVRLYALDKPLDVAAGLTKDELLAEMGDHILEEVELAASYERPRRS